MKHNILIHIKHMFIMFFLCTCPLFAQMTIPTAQSGQVDAHCLLEQGKKEFSNGSLEKAIELFEKARSEDQYNTEISYVLGITYCLNGDYEKGIDLLEQVNRSVDDSQVKKALCNACFMLGIRDAKEKKIIDAETMFSRAVSIDPSKAKAYCNRGVCRVMLKKYDEALSDFSMAEKNGFKSLEMQLNHAVAYERTGKKNKAINLYNEILQYTPKCASAHYNLAVLLQQKAVEQPDKARFINGAIRHYKRAIELDPSFYEAAFNLSRIYFAKHSISVAITWIRKALDINNNLDYAHLLLAQLYFEKGSYNNSLAQVRYMEEKGYNDPQLRKIRTQIYNISGKK